MAGLENLISSIYHERQQPGSMLCAQHALNNLLRMSVSLRVSMNPPAQVLRCRSQRGTM